MTTQTTLLLDILFDEPISEEMKERIIATLPTDMPEKGEGRICVDDVQKAESILKDHVGEFEWPYYPDRDGLIQHEGRMYNSYYGKFDIEDLPGLWRKLVDGGVRIYDVSFVKDEPFYRNHFS